MNLCYRGNIFRPFICCAEKGSVITKHFSSPCSPSHPPNPITPPRSLPHLPQPRSPTLCCPARLLNFHHQQYYTLKPFPFKMSGLQQPPKWLEAGHKHLTQCIASASHDEGAMGWVCENGRQAQPWQCIARCRTECTALAAFAHHSGVGTHLLSKQGCKIDPQMPCMTGIMQQGINRKQRGQMDGMGTVQGSFLDISRDAVVQVLAGLAAARAHMILNTLVRFVGGRSGGCCPRHRQRIL